MKEIAFTGERFVPGIEDENLTTEHFQRYLSVCDIVRGKTVLDAACGEGYGSHLMAEYAQRVTGLDISEEAVKWAGERYRDRSNLKFVTGDVTSLPFGDKSFDIVVSFETIEHISEQQQQAFLQEIRRVLKEDGCLLMSTPNRTVYSDRYGYRNEFHVKEFYVPEFVEFLKQEFKNVTLFHQYYEVASVLDAGFRQKGSDTILYRKDGDYEGEPKYVIAAASDSQIDGLRMGSVFVGKKAQYAGQLDRILTLQREEEERNNHIRTLDEGIAKRDSDIVRLNSDIVRLNQEVEERNTHIQKLDREISDKADQYDTLNREYEFYRKSLEKRVNGIFDVLENDIQEKNRIIARLQDENDKNVSINESLKSELQMNTEQLKGSQDRIQELEIELNNKKGHIELLLESERAFEREKKTRLYRLSVFLRKVYAVFIPPQSKREFLLYVFVQCFKHPRLMVRMINPTRIKNFFIVARKEGMHSVWENYHLTEEFERNGMEKKPERLADESAIKEKAISEYEPLKFEKTDQPLVSIIIPVYNQFAYTYECLRSILENSKEVPYEVIIGDDCSTDNTRQIKNVVSGIKVIVNRKNLRFLKNCNHAAARAKGKYILFLNNDTQVQPEWLTSLIKLIESDESIGMVGSKLLYPDGFLQEAGGIVWKDGSAWNYGNRQNEEASEYNYVKEVDYISGASIMIRKSLWDEIGGFDERFAPAYCEDSDLAFEVRKHGYKVMFQPLSRVVHFEGVSNGTDTGSGLKSYQLVNQQKFIEKWRDVLETEHFPNGENVFSARDRSSHKKTILMVDHYVPQYDRDAGSRTVFQYLKMFVNKGYHVKFIGDNFYRHEPYTTVLQQMGIEVLYGPYYAENWKKWIRDNGNVIQYVFLNRPHVSVKYIDFIRENTGAKIVYYGHDLHFLREKRKYELTKDKKALEDSEEWKEKELELMKKADVVYYPSSVEVKEIEKIDQTICAKAIVAYVFDKFQQEQYCYEERKDLMFVGGFAHPPNMDAVLWFAKEIFPDVKKAIPDIRFYILGSNPPTEIEKLDDGHIVVKGLVSDEELERYYRNCRISVVPLRYGAGIKGKVIEAMHLGIPVVTTSVGVEGIEGAENILCVENDGRKLAERIVALYQNKEALEKMSRRSCQYIQDNFSEIRAWSVISDDFS